MKPVEFGGVERSRQAPCEVAAVEALRTGGCHLLQRSRQIGLRHEVGQGFAEVRRRTALIGGQPIRCILRQDAEAMRGREAVPRERDRGHG